MADPKNRRVGHSSRGAYLLEAAMVVFGVAVFIVGIADISRIFHARGAVRMGVTDGLRCLYPTDPNCQSTQPPQLAPPAPRFNAWVWGSNTGYQSPQNNYRLVAQSYDEPFHEVPLLRSWLSRVEVEQPKVYRDYDLVFPINAYSPYLLKTSDLPILHGDNARTPRFLERDLRTGSWRQSTRNPNDSITAPNLRPTGGRSERTVTIDVSAALPDGANRLREIAALEAAKQIKVPCYQGALSGSGNSISWPAQGEPATCLRDSGGPSLVMFQGGRLKVPVMIHVTGSPGENMQVDGNNARGEVELTLNNGERDWPLGGVSFGRNDDNANIITRGAFGRVGHDATPQYFRGCDEKKPNKYTECWEYPLLWIYLDSPATLKLELKRNDGSPDGPIGWDGGQIHLFFPTFQFVNESRSCSSKTPGQCPNSLAPFRAKYYETNIQGMTAERAANSDASCYDTASGFESTGAGVAYYQANFTSQPSTMSATRFKVSSREAKPGCVNPKNWYSCTKVTTEHLQGCDPRYTLPEKEQRCQINDYMPSIDKIVKDELANEQTGRADRREACTGSKYPSCATIPVMTPQRQFLGWGPQSCAVAIPNDLTTDDFGPHFQYLSAPGCPDVIAAVTEQFMKKHGIPPGTPLTHLIVTPADSLNSPVPPEDPCRVVRQSSNPTDEKLCAQNAPSWVVENCCRESNNKCRVVAAPSQPGSGSGTGGGFGAINLQPAVARAQEAVSVAYPATRMQDECDATGINCLDVTAELANNNTEAVMRASMDVPLALFSWLGAGATTTVEYEERRALERSLVGVAR